MSRSASRRPFLLALLWAGLGAWIAVWLLFGAVIAPAAFRVVPSAAMAGDLVGQILGPVHLAGAVLGLVLTALSAKLGHGRLAVGLPLLLTALCLFNHFGVSPAVAEIDFANLQPGDAERFARLHELSVGIYFVVAVGVLWLAGLHGRSALRPVGDPTRGEYR